METDLHLQEYMRYSDDKEGGYERNEQAICFIAVL